MTPLVEPSESLSTQSALRKEPAPLLGEPSSLFLKRLLKEQSQLTEVERFSWLQDHRELSRNETIYRHLMPARLPGKGEQYAFEVDLDKCSGCKACVSACHSLNGLDEDETWRAVGLLISKGEPGPKALGLQQHVTTACHHCVDPGCLNGCPVLAYEKDPVTGIVRHLDDQCMGCSYCIMKCPYEVPKYSTRLGIVRKCDMCTNRLSAGEPPACVQGCPTEAIRITVVGQTDVETQYRQPSSACDPAQMLTNAFLPDSPNPQITLPTTRYVSHRGLPANVEGANHAVLQLESAHWPLVWMLVLTQAAAGMFVGSAWLTVSKQGIDTRLLDLTGLGTLFAGLTASILHLGQPLKAWRAFLGWRRSWLSREIIALNLFAGLAGLTVAGHYVPSVSGLLAADISATIAALAGVGGVICSAMVYVDTRRAVWSPRLTFTSFLGTTVLLGSAFATALLALSKAPEHLTQVAGLIALTVLSLLFLWRRLELLAALQDPASPVHANARTLRQLLPGSVKLQGLLFIGANVFGLLTLNDSWRAAPLWAVLSALATLSSEIAARYVFFAAGGSKRMPGALSLEDGAFCGHET